METFNGFTLFVVIIFLFPIIGILIKLIISFQNNEAIKEILESGEIELFLYQRILIIYL